MSFWNKKCYNKSYSILQSEGVDYMAFQSAIGNLHPIAYFIIFLIIGIFAFSIAINIIIRKKYKLLQHDLENPRGGKFKSDILNDIISDYESAAMGNYSEVNTQAIIEKCFNTKLTNLALAERFIKHAVSLLIVLGLLGTFVGLTMSVGKLVELLIGMEGDKWMDVLNSIGPSLLTSLRGMSAAFVTSLFGIACSVMLTIFNIIINVEETRETLMVHIEEYLDNTISLVLSKDKETEYSMMNKILRNTFVEFGKKIENSLQSTVESFGEKLKGAVMEVDLSSKTLDNTVDRFDRSLSNLSDNIKDFMEFNTNLRNNIEIMDVSFIKVTEAIKDSTKVITDNYSNMEGFSKNIQNAAGKITGLNKNMIEDMKTLIEKVNTSITSTKKLSKSLQDQTDQNTVNMQKYHDNFSSLMVRLSKELSLLGEQTSDAFSKTLSETSKSILSKLTEEMENILEEIYTLLNTFKKNEDLLSKTITTLPDQVLTYSETAASKMDKQLNEIRDILDKNNK